MKRRKFLALSSVTALWILNGCSGGGGTNTSSNNNGIFSTELPIPTLLKPTDINGVKNFDLTVQNGKHQFFKDIDTDTYGISSTYLGPTLLISNGDDVSVNFTNKLSVDTTMHSHGMHVPPSMDGTAHQTIKPNTTWSAKYTVKQKASTSWYHSHAMHKTAEQVYKGLAGLIIVEDTQSNTLDLPKTYGVDDIPLVLQDRVFTNNQINYSPSNREIMRGYKGDTFIANGAISPVFNAESKEIRFRILNGSNSSIYNLGFDTGKQFNQIATDGGLLEAPVSISKVLLSPAERAEIVVDLTNDSGKTMVLKDFNTGNIFLTINVNKTASSITTLPSKLSTLEKFTASQAVKTRKFTLEGKMGSLSINGKAMDMNVINEVVQLGNIEIWEVKNTMMIDHNFHIHATHFMLLERNGSSANVLENEKGYKDVALVPANGSIKFIVKMIDYTDSTVPYMYHCHFLEHEDAGMMGQFTVV
jgi:FtsP/CotA-like multicopper oxidase with cupredoxin domain